MKQGDEIDLSNNPGIAAEVSKKHLLDAGLRILTDDVFDRTLTRIDLKYNDIQYSICFSSSKVGQSILSSPKEVSNMAMNISLNEFTEKLEELLRQLKSI